MYIGFACMALCLYNIYYYPCRSRQKKLRICLLLTRVRRVPTLRYRSCLPHLWPQLRHCPQLHLLCWPTLCLPQLHRWPQPHGEYGPIRTGGLLELGRIEGGEEGGGVDFTLCRKIRKFIITTNVFLNAI